MEIRTMALFFLQSAYITREPNFLVRRECKLTCKLRVVYTYTHIPGTEYKVTYYPLPIYRLRPKSFPRRNLCSFSSFCIIGGSHEIAYIKWSPPCSSISVQKVEDFLHNIGCTEVRYFQFQRSSPTCIRN